MLEVERALSEPDEPTDYFPPVNIIHVGSMVNSQILQGSHGSTQNQHIDQSSRNDIRAFVDEFRRRMPELQLSPEIQSEATADLTTIDAQLESPKPKPGILRESLQSLRTILEGAAGNAVASEIFPKLAPILAALAQAA